MRAYVQWATASPGDWLPVEARRRSDVLALPKRPPLPTQAAAALGFALDQQPGWVAAVNCQGVEFTGGDHVAIEPITDDLLVITSWTDPAATNCWAVQFRFAPPAPDPRFDGRMNTVQSRIMWVTDDLLTPRPPSGDVRPYSEFVPPPDEVTLHCPRLPDAAHRANAQARTPHGWREWLP